MLLLSIALLACSGGPSEPASPEGPAPVIAEPEAPPATGPSLLVVTVDTTRADRIGAYGYGPAHTPTIDGLAAGGTIFERAYATVPLTTPSHASMFTGLYPTRHGIHTNGDAVLPEHLDTLAEHLQRGGYDTAASVAAFVTTRIWNFDQGFDAFFDEVGAGRGRGDRWGRERSAAEVNADLVPWLAEEREGAFFVWAHYYDPHAPYEPSKEWARKVPSSAYDAEIAEMDNSLGELVAAAEAAAGPAGLTVIVIADHGEALFGEHGESSHGMFLFDPTMRIPFVVRPAGTPSPARVVDQLTVSNVDLMPTALGLLGLPVPEGLDGADLSPWISGEGEPREPVYMESDTVRTRLGFAMEVAAAQGPLKLMDTPNPRLFDVVADPFEATNLLDQRPTEVAALRAFIEAQQAEAIAAAGDAPSPEVLEQLAALGYVGSDFEHDESGKAIDAKDQGPLIRRLEAARKAMQDPETLDEAVAEYTAIVEEFPQLSEARMGLARGLSAQGKLGEAEAVFRDAVERQPTSAVLRTNFANNLASQGRFSEGVDQLREVLERVPEDDLARIGLVRMLSDSGQEAEALTRLEQWLAAAPDNPAYQAHAGILLTRKGEKDRAWTLLNASLSDGVPRQFVRQDLGRLSMERGDPVAAQAHFEAELENFPRNRPVREQLAGMYMAQKKWDDAVAEYTVLLEAAPEEVFLRRSLAQATFNTGDYKAARDVLAPALASAPEDPDVLLLQANILAKLDRREEGEALFTKANELKRAQMKQRLEALKAKEGTPPPAAPGPQ